MIDERAICTLDYLIGTLATAYKGLVKSLVVKDFCMTEKESVTIFKGTLLSIPEGDYQASLIHEGIEISRGPVQGGYFELQAESGLIEAAKNLQLDIIQNGRHIGTFLLKREKKEGFFVSALELSEEIRDINFGLLTAPLRDKVGLLKKAEDIISAIMSTKQDWKKLTETIHSFSNDLFWFDKEAFLSWFDIVLKWLLTTCKRIESERRSRAVSNVLSLIELPIEEERNPQNLKLLVDTWLSKVVAAAVDLSADLNHSGRVLSALHRVFPDTDIRQVLGLLVTTSSDRIENTPALTDELLRRIKDCITGEDYILLTDYSDVKKKALLATMYSSRSSVDGKNYASVFEVITSAVSWLSKDRDMITVFFDIAERNLKKDSAVPLSKAFVGLLDTFDTFPADIYRRAIGNTVRLMRELAGFGRVDVCKMLLRHIEKQKEPLRTDIILNAETASAVLEADEDSLLGLYNSILERILIPAPKIAGFFHETWAEIADPLHLERLSKFLEILRLGGGSFQGILVRVICNLYVSGVFIPDDRIFQREVSKYLNSRALQTDFLLHYMLLKELPVYYHDVGAMGRLREDTTEIDSWGNDPVLYFIRKQVHVNSSNYLIHLLAEVMKSWVYRDPEVLQGSVPEEILKSLNPSILDGYSSAIRPLFESSGILDSTGFHFDKILEITDDEFDRRLKNLTSSGEVRLKILLVCRIFRDLVKKYSLAAVKAEKRDIVAGITASVKKLRDLKDIIIWPEKHLPEESLYFKRHIAFGIPSVMGSFHETKFDALAEFLKIEENLRTLFDGVITDVKSGDIEFSQDQVKEWIACIGFLNELLQLHDLGNFQIDEAVAILKNNNLHLSQIIDLLRLCQREITWIVDLLGARFQQPLADILTRFPKDELPEYFRGLHPEDSGFISKATDIVMRAVMGSITGLYELDRLINNLAEVFALRLRSGPDELLALTDAPIVRDEYFVIDDMSDADAMRTSPLMGNKAKNLVYLRNREVPVPHGVVLTANRTADYEEYTGSADFVKVLKIAVAEIEKRTGTVFGGRQRPLFLSVRSGSYVSMPGILSSILYCGMNADTVRGLADTTDNPWLAWDSYRRFIEHYGTVVHGLPRDIFDDIIDGYLKGHSVKNKAELNSRQMEEIVHLYQSSLRDMNLNVPEDVYEQLLESVKAVYRSWYSERSLQFKKAVALSEHWGTAVTLMQMIYGNDRDSGASVFFTRKPFTLDAGIYGDTIENATGGELVYGRSVNRPITQQQALTGQKSLEEIDPELFRLHEELARSIEQAMRGLPQEVEATYTRRPDGTSIIYALQTRRMESFRGLTKSFDDVCRMESKVIGRGVGVHGGALSGIATFASIPAKVKELREKLNQPVILLRKEASTDDVSLMPEINGIVTAAGGATSHAAVLAQKFRLAAIVGCSDMRIEGDQEKVFFARIGTFTIREGDHISIDGSTGLVYSGLCFSATEV